MEDEKILGEQPIDSVTANFAEANGENGSINTSQGSPSQKFKSVESLQKAYDDLEKEFTRKSQKLSELMKSIESDNVEKSIPQYSKESWRENIKEFLSKNEKARSFASEISEVLFQDKDLACMPNSLELAYAKVLANKYKSNDELIESENFLNDYVYNNEKIVGNIINKYLSNVNTNKVPPIVLNVKGSSVGFVAPTSPNSLSDAKTIVEKLFNSKGELW